MTKTYNLPPLRDESSSVEDIETILSMMKPRNDELKYEFTYWKTSSVGAVARDLMAIAGIAWEDIHPKVWPQEYSETPSGMFPVLRVRNNENKTLTLFESSVIDCLLAKKFNLMGDGEYEEQLVRTFYMNAHSVRERYLIRVTWNYKDVMDKARDQYLETSIPLWCAVQRRQLEANGNNGHLVGNKLTLADIMVANVLDHIATLPEAERALAVIKECAPELFRVKEIVDNEPRLAQWRQSAKYKEFIEGARAAYKCTGIP
ncbi:hypothetical protein BGZ73_006905 [Actinomortierella ambigua]|nr:hypothetical protein BGZ73_006905 [Actinomortierella ambigua]